MKDANRYPMYIAVFFGGLGFLLIFLAWNGAAEQTTIAAQFPFLISGGIVGIGLLGVGLTLALVTELRKATAELALRLEQVSELVAGASPVATGPTAVPTDESQVVAGRTTYHHPSCRLVAGRSDLQPMAPEDAAERGLGPCRICEPKEPALRPSIVRA